MYRSSPLRIKPPSSLLKMKPPSNPLQAPLQPPWSPLQAPLKPPEGEAPSSPLEAPSSPLQAPSKPLSPSEGFKPPWSPLQAPLKPSEGEAPLKPPWSLLEAPFKPPSSPSKPSSASEGFKPPSSPLEAPLKPPSLQAPFKPPLPKVKPPWSLPKVKPPSSLREGYRVLRWRWSPLRHWRVPFLKVPGTFLQSAKHNPQLDELNWCKQNNQWINANFFVRMLHGSTKVVVRAVALLSAKTYVNSRKFTGNLFPWTQQTQIKDTNPNHNAVSRRVQGRVGVASDWGLVGNAESTHDNRPNGRQCCFHGLEDAANS